MTLRVVQPEYGGTFTTEPPTTAHPRFVLPGERIDNTETPIAVMESSPDRVAPRCPHFGVCGGCDYQHAAYPAQLNLKQTILQQTLAAAGLTDLPSIAVEAAEPWEYRNRIRLRVEQVEGVYRFGYNRRAGRDFLPIVKCPIAHPLLLRAASALLEASATESIVDAWMPSIAEIEFQTNDNVIQMTLFTRNGRIDGFRLFCEALQRRLPELIGGGCLAASAGYGAKERAIWGVGGLAHRVLDRIYWVSRGGFFQVNRLLVSRMVELVTRAREGSLAWDLYAGVGLFSCALAASFQEVVAVESSPVAAADLARAAMSNKTNTLRAVGLETAAFLHASTVQRERPDLIVMDPPRAGLGAEVCGLLARIAAREMVYVSCDPTTLARDLAMLVHSGYRVEKIHLLDMFPQTFHLETVVFLKK